MVILFKAETIKLEEQMGKYGPDHIKIMRVLSTEVPKRPSFKVSDIVTVAFKGQDNGDRRVRNGMRKLRGDDLVEICERGEYRLLPGGVKQAQQWQKDGWPTGKEKSEKPAEKAKKAKKAVKKVAAKAKQAAPKKAVKKVAAKAKKAAPKKAVKTAAPKKAAPKKAAPKKAPKIDMKKAASKNKDAEAKPSNGASKAPEKAPEKTQGAAASQLAF